MECRLAPGHRRAIQLVQGWCLPAIDHRTRQIGITGALGSQGIARCMAGTAMTEPFREIGTTVVEITLRGVRRERRAVVVEQVPASQQLTPVEGELERILGRLGRHRRLGHEIGIQGLHVRITGLGERRIREGWIEIVTFTTDAMAHRSLEGGIGPLADPRSLVRGKIGTVECAEGRIEPTSPRILDPPVTGMAGGTISRCRHQATPFDGFGGVQIGCRPGNGRNGPLPGPRHDRGAGDGTGRHGQQ